MSQELRERILTYLAQQAKAEPNHCVPDTAIVTALGTDLHEVRRQLDILESQGLIKPANSMDGHEALPSPEGLLRVEQLIEQSNSPERPKIGFDE